MRWVILAGLLVAVPCVVLADWLGPPPSRTVGAVAIPASGGGGGTFTLVNHTTIACNANGGTSPGLNLAGTNAKLIVVPVGFLSGSTPVMSDSLGNTWLSSQVATEPTDGTVNKFFFVISPTIGNGQTFSVTGTSIFSTAEVMVFTEAGTPTLDTSTPAHSEADNLGSSTITNPSITPAVSNSLVIAAIGNLGPAETDKTINNSFVRVDNVNSAAGTCFGSASAYFQATSGAVGETWTIVGGSTNSNAAVLQAFSP